MKKTLFISLLIPAVSHGAITLVTDLTEASANWTEANGNTALDGSNPAVTTVTNDAAGRGAGHTVHLEFTPLAADLSGTTVLFEFGGTSNGFALTLVDGVLTYTAKLNASDAQGSTSLNDLNMGDADETIVFQSTFTALQAGVGYIAAASYNAQAQTLTLGIVNAAQTAGQLNQANITGGAADRNWTGNRSISLGVLFNSAGGLNGELVGTNVPGPFDVDDSPVNSFQGTFGDDIAFWNAVGTIEVDFVPEPSTALLGLVGLVGLLRRRRA